MRDVQSAIIMARKQVVAYKQMGYHCSEATIRACSEALGLTLPEETVKAACGFRGGGGGYGDRCGVLETGIMLISCLYGRMDSEDAAWRYSYPIRKLHERFREAFISIYCCDIQGRLLAETGSKDCTTTYEDGAEILIRLICDIPHLLEEMPEEEKAQ